MKLQKTTWILLIAAICLGGVVYFYEIQSKPQREEIQSKKNKIFAFQEEDIQKLTIEMQDKTLQFERTGNVNQPWQMKQPEDTIANDAVVSFLVNLLVGENSDRSFNIPIEQKKDYGLDKPLGTIQIQLKDNSSHQLIIGKPDFQEQFLYAQIDPPSPLEKEITINLVSQDFQSALLRQPDEWQQTKPTPEVEGNPPESKVKFEESP